MATQNKVAFDKYYIALGDGATPTEAFDRPCALASRTFTLTGTPAETNLLDCADESLPMWTSRQINVQSGTISGEGTLDPDDLETWRDFALNGEVKNARIVVDLAAASGGGYYQGPFVLTTFENVSSKENGTVTFSLEMQSAGAITWTDAAS